jgi:drug/metabolite transporter (DMT)-like permease
VLRVCAWHPSREIDFLAVIVGSRQRFRNGNSARRGIGAARRSGTIRRVQARVQVNGRREQRRGAFCGLAAAALFGASAPLAKRLLPQIPPVMLAGLLYGGAALALTAAGIVRARRPGHISGAGVGAARDEARLRRADLPTLAAIVILGGVIGPICMLWGLRQLSGVSGALLLNLEAPLTALLAVLVFHEHLGWRSALAIALIVGAAVLLGARGESGATASTGPTGMHAALAIAIACLAWAIDNNLTQRLSVRDPIAVVRLKALGAAGCNLALALAAGMAWPRPALLAAALIIGAASYGVSVVLDFYALRILGAAREAAYFATAPFAGALVAIPLLGESPGRTEWWAGAAMIAGVAALLRDRHAHGHTHEVIEHDHLHVHDQHHVHAHSQTHAGPHAHPHRHDAITHDHPHSSDIHHRHRH